MDPISLVGPNSILVLNLNLTLLQSSSRVGAILLSRNLALSLVGLSAGILEVAHKADLA